MTSSRLACLGFASALLCAAGAHPIASPPSNDPGQAAPAFLSWAPAPPMGWNSWDAFGTTVTEAQTKQQADYMAAHLKAHGWQYVVVDIQWYEPSSQGHEYREGAPLTMDGFGRLLPAPNRFPSSANGAGFKPLADYVHSLGLRFGVHLMRGIPRQAVAGRTPVTGTRHTADQVADRSSICPWNPDMYGVDMTKPGAQEYYDSVYALLASWGVDFVKVDDISRPYHDHASETEAIRKAIDRTGRPIVLSLSPGETALTAADHVRQHANMWRISDDFWDRWLALYEQFGRLERWNPHRRQGAWPDPDMIPFGWLGTRATRFTRDEQVTLLTLWSISRSPLMHGGDLTKTDDATLSMLTNDEVLAVDQRSENNRPLFNRDELIAWIADVPGSPDKYLAVFNARDRVRLTPEHARYRSGIVTHDRATVATIDVDLAGATRLYLRAEPVNRAGAHALWIDPTLVFADGTTKGLSELEWTAADALWDSAFTDRNAGKRKLEFSGKPVKGISTLVTSLVEYALPPGAIRFRATGALGDRSPREADVDGVRFVVSPATARTEHPATALPIPVTLADLGFTGPVAVRDLWSHGDLGTFTGEFAPHIPFHGAGLYRLSPR
jgi:hypothetical protein